MSSQFEFLGFPHITAMGVTLALPIFLTIVVKRLNSAKATQAVCGAFAGVLLLNEILPWSHRLSMVGAYEFARWYLPLHVCSITVFAVAAALIFRWQTAYEIAYFWGLAGATMPSSRRRSRLIIQRIASFNISSRTAASSPARCSQLGARHATDGQVRPPRLCAAQSLGYCRVRRQLGAGSNYMFLSRPPVTQSPFFFAPWPWYIPILAGVALVLFYVLFIPFKIGRRVDSS